jgi:putative phosphoesterase
MFDHLQKANTKNNKMNILVISDIHGNFPALQAVYDNFQNISFDLIVNTGDLTVYAPFADEVLDWLQEKNVISILGNTDIKVKKLIKSKNFKKPSKPEKRIMYTATAEDLSEKNKEYLCSLKKKKMITCEGRRVGLFHGSPADPDEFLFDTTPKRRLEELAATAGCNIIITGHSHTPYTMEVDGVHFINPGSVGRMFDGDPRASCAILHLEENTVHTTHHRVAWDIDKVVSELARRNLPGIYGEMYKIGRKLN